MTTSGEQLLVDLYRQHARELSVFVHRYLHDRGATEDVVQETMLRAWRHVDRLEPASNPRAYLFTVARNVLTDRWRAQRSRPVLVGEDSPDAGPDRVPTDDEVESAVERWVVADALGRLTPEHRAVVQALYYEGCTMSEAASLLSLPVGTVKSRSYYAVRALRAALEEQGVVR